MGPVTSRPCGREHWGEGLSLVELDHPEDDCHKKDKRHYRHNGVHCGCEFHLHRKFLSVVKCVFVLVGDPCKEGSALGGARGLKMELGLLAACPRLDDRLNRVSDGPAEFFLGKGARS